MQMGYSWAGGRNCFVNPCLTLPAFSSILIRGVVQVLGLPTLDSKASFAHVPGRRSERVSSWSPAWKIFLF